MSVQDYAVLDEKANILVKRWIPGHRKGLPDVQAYLHSVCVQEIIESNLVEPKLSPDVGLAALLHDLVEDGGVTFEELTAEGFSARTVELVRLCTHEDTDLGKDFIRVKQTEWESDAGDQSVNTVLRSPEGTLFYFSYSLGDIHVDLDPHRTIDVDGQSYPILSLLDLRRSYEMFARETSEANEKIAWIDRLLLQV